MKKNLFLRLCLILLVTITIYSCRTDHFQEQETYNNISKFQLTSKRISLNDAKHKAKLLLELQKAEKEVEKQKLNIQGKLVNIGNGINIDTDNVIYMENGPDFHTYTFSVIRDNTPINAPIENLLLTPNPDGSYRVFHIVLNLTEADKAKIANREYVNYKNKEQITELAGVNLSSLSQKQLCIPHYYSYPVKCKDNLHEPGEPCAYAGEFGAAYWGSIVLYDCFGEEPATIMPTPTPINGGGGGGGECPDCPDNNTPVQCIQAPTDPTQVGIVDPNGCIVGMPTDPNLPLPTVDPCRKAKVSITAANNILKNPTVHTKMDSILKGKTQAANEWAVAVEQKPDGTYDASIAKEGTKFESSAPPVQVPNIFIGDGHSHAGAPGKPSGGDLYEMLKALLTNANFKYRYVYGNYFGVPENYALIVSDRDAAIAFLGQFPRSENYDELQHSIRRDSPLGLEFYKAVKHYSEGRSENSAGEDYDANAIAMAYILEKLSAGINIAKTDLNGDLKKIVVNIQKITIPASGGIVKEGVKVSKCP